jgi:hypothetical protein
MTLTPGLSLQPVSFSPTWDIGRLAKYELHLVVSPEPAHRSGVKRLITLHAMLLIDAGSPGAELAHVQLLYGGRPTRELTALMSHPPEPWIMV